MNCIECVGQINDTDATCPHCGAAQTLELPPEFAEDVAQDAANRNEVVLLAERAMQGDDSVWGEIYEKTKRYVYYIKHSGFSIVL